jgi:hypothetical protein
MDIYEHPIKENEDGTVKDHLYVICVDVAEGKQLDSSTFTVIDISTTPYKFVAKYKSCVYFTYTFSNHYS